MSRNFVNSRAGKLKTPILFLSDGYKAQMAHVKTLNKAKNKSLDEGPESPHHTRITGRGRRQMTECGGGSFCKEDFQDLEIPECLKEWVQLAGLVEGSKELPTRRRATTMTRRTTTPKRMMTTRRTTTEER